ncbi:MAG: MFS transporter [Lachnospiraceae bacterium]
MECNKKLKKAPAYRFLVFVEMMLCYVLLYAGIQMIATLGTDIMEALQVSESALSIFSAVGNPAMAIVSVVAGFFTARIGGKKVLVTGLFVMSLSGWLYLTGPESLLVLILIRVLQGLGSGMVSATVQALVSVWFPAKERGTAQGALACFYGVSTSAVTVYAGVMSAKNMEWYQTAGYLLAICGIVFAVLVIFGYKDIEKTYGINIIDEVLENGITKETIEIEKETASWEKPNTWEETLRCPAFWILGFSLFFYGGSAFGVGFVIPMFLRFAGYDVAGQTAVMTYGSLASVIFSLLGGVIADRVFHGRRTQVYAISFGGATVLTIIMMITGGNLPALEMSILYFFMFGFTTFSGGPAWVLPVEIVGSKMAQQNVGTCLLFSGMGSTIMLIVYGYLADHYSVNISMLALAGCMMIPCILAIILGKKYKV